MPSFIGAFCSLCMALSISNSVGPVQSGATANVYWQGQRIGVYVDDQEPNQCQKVADLLKTEWLVISAVPMGNNYRCSPGKAINLLEWYPFPAGQWGSSYTPPCNSDGYILPDKFHWDGDPPYTQEQKSTLFWNAVKTCHPYMVVWF